jgi:hypothetical protein
MYYTTCKINYLDINKFLSININSCTYINDVLFVRCSDGSILIKKFTDIAEFFSEIINENMISFLICDNDTKKYNIHDVQTYLRKYKLAKLQLNR